MKNFLVFAILFFGSISLSVAQYGRSDRFGFGLGPAILYGDNAGIYEEFKFMVLPSAAVDYSLSLSTYLDIKATFGWQMLNSGDYLPESRKELFSSEGLPYGFKGNLIYGDIMPVFLFNPDRSGYLHSLYKVYSGIGVGFFHSQRTDERYIFTESGKEALSYSATGAHFYIPFRVGVFKSLNNTNGEIGLEATAMFSPFGEMDGNDWHMRGVNMDIASQLQFFYRFSIGYY
jgi:hypothetical protein